MSADERVTIDVDDAPAAEDAAIVDAGLGTANERAAPVHEVRRLATFARVDGRVVGGAVGRTWGRCCELQQLWVDERFRRRGVATRLVQAFEARAAQRGCTAFYLETFSFQAPDFYARLGYAPAHAMHGFPHGIARFLMTKDTAGGS